jgi:histidyl-tRNA synthetase
MEKIEPQTLRGFQDLLPGEMIARAAVVETVRRVYERYGFLPIDTPIIERMDILTGTAGGDTNKQIFELLTPEEEPAALRFDLTVPFARAISQYREEMKLPFRRYAVGPVFRADKPGPGRFRQFTQMDIDIAGADTLAADAEVIAVMCDAMRALGLGARTAEDGTPVRPVFEMRISNRRLVDALLEGNGITKPETIKHVLRVMDKLQKVGLGKMREELGAGRVDESGAPIAGVHLPEEVIERITAFVAVSAATRTEMVEALAGYLPHNEQSAQALDEMAELARYLDALGVAEAEAPYDPSLTRGLDYYTGPVFEIGLPAAPEFGSVGGGGRYDELCTRFLEERVPATGASIGVDRLIAALASLGIVKKPKTNVQVSIATVGKVPREEVFRLAAELRALGFNTLTYLGGKKSMSAQLSDADRYAIPVAVILGEDELANSLVSVKDLIAGKAIREGIIDREAYRSAGRQTQVTVPRAEMESAIRKMLEA